MTAWRTQGLSGQVFDAPASPVDAWDLRLFNSARRIAGMSSLRERRAALAAVERAEGRPARTRLERQLKRIWESKR